MRNFEKRMVAGCGDYSREALSPHSTKAILAARKAANIAHCATLAVAMKTPIKNSTPARVVRLMMARLSTIKTLAGFDFSFQPSLDKNRIMALAELEFINRSEVVHFLGPPGTGKSHLSLALGVQAVKAGRSVYFTPLSDLISALAKAEREGTLREKIRFFCRFSLLIVDEIGYLPVVAGGGNLFFQLVNARYEKGAMILTSNRGFAEWGEVFGDPVVATALLDRLLHHIQIEGSSYGLRQHADLIPEHIRSNALVQPPTTATPIKRRGRPPKNGGADHQNG